MALVIEDGTGVTGADSYATVEQLQEYADNRGITVTGNPEHLLRRAMDYVETLSFIGTPTSRDQLLQWPRSWVSLGGWGYMGADEIPAQLIKGQIVTALAIDDGRDPLSSVGAAVKSEKVDVLEVVYQDGAPANPINVDINRAFAGLVRGGVGGNQIPVYRS